MKRFGTVCTLISLALGLVLAPMPCSIAQAQDATVPITPENAAEVVQLARFGRGEVQTVTWSPDGTQLLIGSTAGVWIYDTTDLSAPPALLPGTTTTIRNIVFNADRTRIAAGDGGGTVHVWDAATHEKLLELTMEGNFSTSRADFSPDGSQIIMSNGDNLLLRDAATGEILIELKDAHTNLITGVHYSPDGSLIVTNSSDKTARLWDAATLTEVAVMEGHTSYVNDAAFSPDGSLIVTVGSDKTTRMWDGKTGAEIAVYEQERGNVFSVSFDPTGTFFVTGSSYGDIHLFNVDSFDAPVVWEEIHDGDISAVAVSPDGMKIASIGRDQAAKIWDFATHEELDSAPGYTQSVGGLALNEADNLILASSHDTILRAWNITGDDVHPVFEQADVVSASTDSLVTIALSPDNAQFAGIRGSYIRVWDTATQELVFEAGEYGLGSFRSLAYSPNGALIAVATNQGTVILWDAHTGDQLTILTGHGGNVTPVLFNADGSLVISGGVDGTIRVWGLPATAAALGIGSGESAEIASVTPPDNNPDVAPPDPTAEPPATPEPTADGAANLLPPSLDNLPTTITGPADCHNVAIGITDFSSQFNEGYAPAYLLDGDPDTGWSSAGYESTEYIIFKLDGKQTVNGILLNSYSPSASYELDSIKDFRVDVPDGTAGTPVFSGQAALTEGFQVYTFPPVTTDRLRFTFTSTHGGDYFEAAEVMICAVEENAAPPTDDGVLRQWASSATASSQYTDTDWNAAQATGAPDTAECGDIPTAWASAEPDGEETLTVYFDTPVVPQQVNIYQTYTPGSITGITLLKGKTGIKFPVPNSADPGTRCPGVFSVTIPPDLTMDNTIDGVRIELDQHELGGWNEIDAVELVGTP